MLRVIRIVGRKKNFFVSVWQREKVLKCLKPIFSIGILHEIFIEVFRRAEFEGKWTVGFELH